MSEFGKGATIKVKQLYKIFGPRPDRALKLVNDGCTKETLHRQYGNVLALNNVSLDAEKGHIHVIMGLSGSGKSTLVRCINKLVEPTCGEIFVDDENILEMNKARLRTVRNKKLGMVFQNYGLLPHLSVLDNASFGLSIRGLTKTDRYKVAVQALTLVGLREWANSKIVELSGGMQQRVGLARALALDTPILLMDEPFSGLDPLIRNELQDELLKIQKELKKTILFITHSIDEAVKVGDEITMLKDGQIIDHGTPQHIIFHSTVEYVNQFAKNCNPLLILKARDVFSKTVPIYVLKSHHLSLLDAKNQNHENEWAFVIEETGHFVGVTKNAANMALKSEKSFNDIIQSTLKLHSDELIIDKLSEISDTKFPIAVCDDNDVFLGAFTHKDILEYLKR